MSIKNFHLPLPDETYRCLRVEAEQARVPATTLARKVIDQWLRVRKKRAKHEAIASYAAQAAGTEFDLDSALEAAGIDQLMNESKAAR